MVIITKNLIHNKINRSVLNLNDEDITSIKIDVFFSFHNLTELDLGNNRLKAIELEFISLVNLKILDLSVNLIESINNIAFHNLVNLEIVDLSKNKLNGKISEHLFDGLNNLEIIDLADNGFDPDRTLHLTLGEKVKHISFRKIKRNSREYIEDALYYKMNHSKRGFALLIIHDFKNLSDAALPEEGCKNDLANLKALFKRLNFEIIEKKNQTAKQIQELLSKYAVSENKDTDCFFCAISSHGNKHGTFGADNVVFNLQETIFNTFQNCLIGKPKLFFIDACRGAKINGNGTPTLKTAGSSESEIPYHSDILISYSTVQDYVSFIGNEGSWFIQSLVKTFKRFHKSTHLIDMLTLVSNDVAKITANTSKQMPSLVLNTLRKRVLFE